jgi:hypothetical protein
MGDLYPTHCEQNIRSHSPRLKRVFGSYARFPLFSGTYLHSLLARISDMDIEGIQDISFHNRLNPISFVLFLSFFNCDLFAETAEMFLFLQGCVLSLRMEIFDERINYILII